MSQKSYLINWKNNLTKQLSYIPFDKLKRPLPLAKGVSFSPSSQIANEEQYDKKNEKEDINRQLEILKDISNQDRRLDIISDNEDMEEDEFEYDEEGTIEDYDDEYEQQNKPWYTKLREIASRPRERITIGEEKVLSPTPTVMTGKDVPIIIYTRMPVILPRFPRLLGRPQFYFE